MKSILTTVLLLSALISIGQDTNQKNLLALELDPAPFILNGYSFSLKYSHAKLPKWGLMASVYSSEFPDGMINKSNKDQGWESMQIETSYAVFVKYHLNENRKGFYFGPAFFWYNKSVMYSQTEERIDFTNVYPNVVAGYNWYPFKKIGLYLNPWLSLGSELNIDDKNTLNGVEFIPNSFNYILALHIGYSIQF